METGYSCSPSLNKTDSGLSTRSNIEDPGLTGISNIENGILSFINPSNGLHLTTGRPMDVSIYDLNGRLIATHSQITKLDVPLENGMYLVTLNDGRYSVTKRLVVVR